MIRIQWGAVVYAALSSATIGIYQLGHADEIGWGAYFLAAGNFAFALGFLVVVGIHLFGRGA